MSKTIEEILAPKPEGATGLSRGGAENAVEEAVTNQLRAERAGDSS